MKTLIMILMLGLGSLTVAAQGHVIVGGGYGHRVPVHAGVRTYAPFYPYYGFWSPGYPYYPYYPSYGYSHPSRLEMKVEDIKTDYKDKIWSARHDENLTRQQRKTEVHRLKTERDQAIQDLKLNYYKQPS
jgi:hypothetical protein